MLRTVLGAGSRSRTSSTIGGSARCLRIEMLEKYRMKIGHPAAASATAGEIQNILSTINLSRLLVPRGDSSLNRICFSGKAEQDKMCQQLTRLWREAPRWGLASDHREWGRPPNLYYGEGFRFQIRIRLQRDSPLRRRVVSSCRPRMPRTL